MAIWLGMSPEVASMADFRASMAKTIYPCGFWGVENNASLKTQNHSVRKEMLLFAERGFYFVAAILRSGLLGGF